MDKYIEELSALSKGKKSIAEALKELDVAKEAFLRASRIENRILTHEEEISDIKTRMELLSTYSYVNSKSTEFQTSVENIVQSKLEEYTFQLMFELNKKVDKTEFIKSVEKKVSWAEFLDLKNLVLAMKLKLDTYLEVEYPAHKSKLNSYIVQLGENNNHSSNISKEICILNEKLLDFESKMKEIQRFKPLPNPEKIENKPSTVLIRSYKIEDNKNDGISEKIEDIKKDLANIMNESSSSSSKFKSLEEILKSLLSEIEILKENCKSLQISDKMLETHFIKCLRNKDLQNSYKKDKIMIEKLTHKDLEYLRKEIRQKNKRIVIVENNLSHLTTEFEYIKTDLLKKYKSLYDSFQGLAKEKNQQDQKFDYLKNSFETITDTVDKKLKRSYDSIKVPIEDFYKNETPKSTKRIYNKITDRPFNISPRSKIKIIKSANFD